MKTTITTLGTLMLFLLLLAGCTGGTAEPDNSMKENSSIVVKASFYPLAHFAEQVLGDLGDVESLTPTGTEPHSFEPTARSIASLYEADLLLFNGAMLDPWAKKLAPGLEAAGVHVIEMSAHFDLRTAEDDDPGHGEFDPHIWLDPVLAQNQVAIIRDALIEIDSKNAAAYRDHAANYIAKLQTLDAEFKTTLSSCSQTTAIVAHDAFNYLAARYGFEILPISGLSPEEEPSAGALAELVDLAEDNNIRYVFFEALASPALSETIAAEIKGETLVLNPLEGLTNEQVAADDTYLSLMRDNLTNLSIALECR